jgi:hypothetical protein
MILSKLLFSVGVSSFAASITASRSNLSQILMLSIVNACGIVPYQPTPKISSYPFQDMRPHHRPVSHGGLSSGFVSAILWTLAFLKIKGPAPNSVLALGL